MYLIPQPNSIKCEKENAVFLLRYQTEIVLDAAISPESSRQARLYASLLQQEIMDDLGLMLPIQKRRDNSEKRVVFFACREELGREEYTLSVTAERITVCGGGAAGLLYGVQTLRQIIRQSGRAIPCLEIRDAPKIGHRGLSYDVTRGRVPTLQWLKKLVDTLSFYKYNQLQLYVEHSYLFRDFSEVWRNNTPLTAEEILELDEYCKMMQIELIPSLASFGHLYEVLSTKSYSHLCELEHADEKAYSLVDRMGHHTVDVSNEESFTMIAGRMKEFMDLFSSRYFNICADETFDLCKGKSRELGEQKGVKRVYVDFLKKLCDCCLENGRIPMFWGDVLIEKPELLSELPKEAVCLNWEYAPWVKEDQVRILTDAGVENLYLCPGVQSWNHLINRHGDAYENILKMCVNAHKYHVQGILNTEWGDLGHPSHPEFSTIGQIYGAAFSWSDKIMAEEEINRAISVIQYGDTSGEVVSLFRKLADQECVNWWHAVQYREEQCGIRKPQNPEEQLKSILSAEVSGTAGKALFIQRLQRNRELTELLYDKLSQVQGERRRDVYAYILMGEGQELLALTGCLLENATRSAAERESAEDIVQDAGMLAVRLEQWIMYYKELWRSVSKESELFRIVEVICWYADKLREM